MDTDPIARRHAKFRAPEGIVFGLVQRATGRRPTARTKISSGYDNEVYRVDTDGGGSVVVRIHRFGEVGPRQERWALERCLEAGVPVPRVLSVETVRLPDGEFDAMVQECVAGVPLDDVMREMSEAEWSDVCRQAGVVLGQIHAIRVGGYYRLNPDGSWDFPTFSAIAKSSLRGRASERDRLIASGFSPEDCARMMRLLEESLEGRPDGQPVLCHGDFQPEHIFVGDDLSITAVIDFGEFQGGHPPVDFTQLEFWERPVDFSALAEGYPEKGWFGPGTAEIRALERLEYLMGYCAYLVGDERTDERDYMCNRLRETLDWLVAQTAK